MEVILYRTQRFIFTMESIINSIVKFKPKYRKLTFCCIGIVFAALCALLLFTTNSLPFSFTSESVKQITKMIVSIFV